MKKIIILLFFVSTILLSSESFAQQGAYNKGDKILMAGVGFGTYSGYGGIPLVASLEFGVHESISVGPFAGFSSGQFWNQFAVGAKGSFHYLPFLNQALELNIDDDRWDFYIALYAGYRQHTYTLDRNFFGLGVRQNYGSALFNPVLGFKYLFTPNIGAYGELGYGALGVGNFGVSFTF
jgi:hypothetical protein